MIWGDFMPDPTLSEADVRKRFIDKDIAKAGGWMNKLSVFDLDIE